MPFINHADDWGKHVYISDIKKEDTFLVGHIHEKKTKDQITQELGNTFGEPKIHACKIAKIP